MTLQAIRYKIEGPVTQAFQTQGVAFYGENQTPTGGSRHFVGKDKRFIWLNDRERSQSDL